jgi:uncharacterized iron-regulated membrane protein
MATTDRMTTPRLQQDDRERAQDSNRTLGLFLLGIVVLLLAVGGYYYATSEQPDTMTYVTADTARNAGEAATPAAR